MALNPDDLLIFKVREEEKPEEVKKAKKQEPIPEEVEEPMQQQAKPVEQKQQQKIEKPILQWPKQKQEEVPSPVDDAEYIAPKNESRFYVADKNAPAPS